MSWVALSCLRQGQISWDNKNHDRTNTANLLLWSRITVVALHMFVKAIFARLIFIAFCLELSTAVTCLEQPFS